LLIVVAGPTAVGKTKVAIQLAQQYKCPILSFDSRQFYKEMNIGTAKPNDHELKSAPHYFINSHSIKNVYTSGKFETEALALLDQIFSTHDTCIAVGGSGLYINALCFGIDEIPTDEKIRQELISRWQNEGIEILQQEVLQIDPEFYNSADMKNPRRVIRALEVYAVSGKPYSFYRKNQAKKREFDTIWFGLTIEKEILFNQINQRVDAMMNQNLLEEVKNLIPFQHLKSLKTVGYQELFSYLNGEISLERAIELIKRNTRNYAKKQLVWFKKNPAIIWVNPNDVDDIILKINDKILKINF